MGPALELDFSFPSFPSISSWIQNTGWLNRKHTRNIMDRRAILCLAIFATACMIDTCTAQWESRTWTGMVGKDPQEVKALIEAEGQGYEVEVMPMNSPVTMDYAPWRVRVFYNAGTGLVCHDPHTG